MKVRRSRTGNHTQPAPADPSSDALPVNVLCHKATEDGFDRQIACQRLTGLATCGSLAPLDISGLKERSRERGERRKAMET